MRAKLTFAFAAALGPLMLAAPVDAQTNATTPVYRCRQENGAITYQDFACKGGVAVEIKPDAADPAAIQRLRRAQADFDRGLAQRLAAEEREAILREQSQQRRELESTQGLDNGNDALYLPDYPLYGPIPRTRLHPHEARPLRPPVVSPPRVPAVIRRPQPR